MEKTLKNLALWVLGLFLILVGIFILIGGSLTITNVFAGIIIVIGFYIIPPVNYIIGIQIRPLFIVLAVIISIIGVMFSEIRDKPQQQETYYVIANNLNVREGQGTNYKIVSKLKKGDEVDVISTENGWTKVVLNSGEEGFVSSKYISNEEGEDYSSVVWFVVVFFGGFIIYSFLFGGSSSNTKVQQHSSNIKTNATPIKKTVNKPQHICKYCGTKNNDLWSLTRGTCHDSPTKKHQPFENGIQNEYICKHCGTKNRDLWSLTRGTCHDSPTKKHQPFESGIQSEYVCKYCGTKNRDLWSLTRGTCHDSPTKKHQPFIN